MNERIKQLDLEAAYGIIDPNRESTPEEIERFKAKFAELIVRECMRMCDVEKADYDKCRKGSWDFDEKNIYSEGAAACDTIKHKMKHRFGVEE